MALRCQQELAELGIDTGEERLSITASIGCAIVTPKSPIKHILAQADKAMYDAKKSRPQLYCNSRLGKPQLG